MPYATSGTSTYIARVLAIRGLEQNNHGYARFRSRRVGHVEAGHRSVIHGHGSLAPAGSTTPVSDRTGEF